jgi:anthranilate/para-aminobenzoate synthase component II
MKNIMTLVCLSLLVLTACHGRKVEDVSMPAAGKTNAQLKTAILAGCEDRGWVCSEVSQGVIEGSLQKGRYLSEVQIPYGNNGYKIVYKNSENLDYNAKKQRIHKAYYKWVIYLNKSIRAALANPQKYAK